MDESDYSIELNNFLQCHASGNLTPCFQYFMTSIYDPGLQRIHHATAQLRGTVIGDGEGLSKGAAKREAAKAALQYIHKHGIPEPIAEEDNHDAVSSLQKYLLDHPGGSLVPWFSWSLSQTDPGHQRTHRATARFDGSEIGHGEGFSNDDAKRIAAIQALKYLQNSRLGPPPPHPRQGPSYDMKERMIDWEMIFKSMIRAV